MKSWEVDKRTEEASAGSEKEVARNGDLLGNIKREGAEEVEDEGTRRR